MGTGPPQACRDPVATRDLHDLGPGVEVPARRPSFSCLIPWTVGSAIGATVGNLTSRATKSHRVPEGSQCPPRLRSVDRARCFRLRPMCIPLIPRVRSYTAKAARVSEWLCARGGSSAAVPVSLKSGIHEERIRRRQRLEVQRTPRSFPKNQLSNGTGKSPLVERASH